MQAAVQDLNENSLYGAINRLLKLKSERDGIDFNCNKLANAIGVPASVVFRLIHPDSEKRVNDPRVNTLLKIVNFFREDGFNVSFDALLGIQEHGINIADQAIEAFKNEVKLPLYSLALGENRAIGNVDIKISAPYSPSIIAFYAEDDIKPIFKRGSIFVIDKAQSLVHKNLIAIRLEDSNQVIIRRCLIENDEVFVQELDSDNKTPLKALEGCTVLGAIIQIDAKT